MATIRSDTTIVSVRLPEVLAAKLTKAADTNKTTRTALVIEALSEYYPTRDEFVEFHRAEIGAEAAEKLWRDR